MQESCKILVIGQVILPIVLLIEYTWLFLIATDKHECTRYRHKVKNINDAALCFSMYALSKN